MLLQSLSRISCWESTLFTKQVLYRIVSKQEQLHFLMNNINDIFYWNLFKLAVSEELGNRRWKAQLEISSWTLWYINCCISYQEPKLLILHVLGKSVVPVANCDEKYYNSHAKTSWVLSDFLDYLINYKTGGNPSSMPCLYLKVLHIIYFSSSWIFNNFFF